MQTEALLEKFPYPAPDQPAQPSAPPINAGALAAAAIERSKAPAPVQLQVFEADEAHLVILKVNQREIQLTPAQALTLAKSLRSAGNRISQSVFEKKAKERREKKHK